MRRCAKKVSKMIGRNRYKCLIFGLLLVTVSLLAIVAAADDDKQSAAIIKNESTSTSATNFIPKGAAEEEHKSSLKIFFLLCVLALGILLIHMMLKYGFRYLPESVAIIFLGALIGFLIKSAFQSSISSWKKEEAFSPNAFFLVLLPPIIFESGYNLHKGNFFQNIGSILVFAIFGTVISAFVIGCGIFVLGYFGFVFRLNFVESFAFGSLISAVDPVATVAIFHALNVDPVLNMLVFGESILNDAISIVLTTAAIQSSDPNKMTGEAVLAGIQSFCSMFFASAIIGVVFALSSALLLKHVDLRKNPSLEFAMMLVFTYAPYVLAEGINLSGIMAILFCGIVMSHYTHFNVSTITQITMQQTLRTLAFIAETCVFAYLGLELFSFDLKFEFSFVFWSLLLCLVSRACNIFPLAYLVNMFREHQINRKMMFIMWFSGLRGAISYALSMHLEFAEDRKGAKHVIVTTTLIIVLITTLVFGGATLPLLRFLQDSNGLLSLPMTRGSQESVQSSETGGSQRKRKKDAEISLSKTKEWGKTIESEHLSEIADDEMNATFISSRLRGFAKWDAKYFFPFFTRRFTPQELKDCKSQMNDLTNKWYQTVRLSNDAQTDNAVTSNNSSASIHSNF